MRARDIMTREPQCCRREDTARRAAEVMRDCDCGVVPVIDEARRVIGIVTDRDLAIRGIAAGKGPDTRLADLMTHIGGDSDQELARDVRDLRECVGLETEPK